MRKLEVIGGGEINQIVDGASHSVVSGGHGNVITGSCSVIAGGFHNTVFGSYSSILGGSLNDDGGLNNVFIAGSGINAGVVGIPNALHVNGLWAGALPVSGVPLVGAPGTIYQGLLGAPPIPGATLLYII